MILRFIKRHLVFLCLTSFALPVLSQPAIKAGIRAGVNIANLYDFEDVSGVDFQGGPFLNIHFNKMYELQPELMYSKYFIKSEELSYSDFKASYLTVGLTNKFFLMGTGLHVLFGGSLDFNIVNEWYKTNSGYSRIDVAPFDISYYGGIGCELLFGLGVEARFKRGGFSTNKDDYKWESDGITYTKTSMLLQAIQVGVYYKM